MWTHEDIGDVIVVEEKKHLHLCLKQILVLGMSLFTEVFLKIVQKGRGGVKPMFKKIQIM